MADKVFTMRIDENLLEQVRVSAEKNKRSLAKEIEYILDFHYNEQIPLTLPDEVANKFFDFLRQCPELQLGQNKYELRQKPKS